MKKKELILSKIFYIGGYLIRIVKNWLVMWIKIRMSNF